MFDPVALEEVNTRLALLYGYHVETSKPLFRVVWAPNEYERRLTEYNNGILLLAPEIQELPKYIWIGPCYLVEKLTGNTRKDIYEGNYIYEPLWPFPEGLPLKWEAVEICVQNCLRLIPDSIKKVIPKNKEDMIYQDNIKKEKEKEEVRDMLGNLSPLQDALSDGSAVSFVGVKQFVDNVVKDSVENKREEEKTT